MFKSYVLLGLVEWKIVTDISVAGLLGTEDGDTKVPKSRSLSVETAPQPED